LEKLILIYGSIIIFIPYDFFISPFKHAQIGTWLAARNSTYTITKTLHKINKTRGINNTFKPQF